MKTSGGKKAKIHSVHNPVINEINLSGNMYPSGKYYHYCYGGNQLFSDSTWDLLHCREFYKVLYMCLKVYVAGKNHLLLLQIRYNWLLDIYESIYIGVMV